MQQIINFIFKNSHRMLFLLLLFISITLTIQSHSYHASKIVSSANFISGNFYSEVNNVEEYFNLKTQNEQLAQENARLKALLFNKKDTTKLPPIEEIKGIDKTTIIIAKVIKNCFNSQENFLTIDKGSKQNITSDMGVVNSLGIVGVIENTSADYATVFSILNVKSKTSAKLKKSNHFGSLIWNGKNAGFAQLIDIPRLASVRKGDTIVTSGQSTTFPANINIGTVYKYYVDNQTNYYTVDVKLFNDMTSLGHVYVIKNKDKEEIQLLEKKSAKDE